MTDLTNKKVLVLGLGPRGRAACELLRRHGAEVVALDSGDSPELRATADRLRAGGVEVQLGAAALPKKAFELAVVSPAMEHSSLAAALAKEKIPFVGELEFGYQHTKCLSIAIAGTNGKGTTAELIERMLTANHRKVILAGHQGRPICEVADQTSELDFLVLQVNSFQLEHTEFFRPAVAVLLNLAPDFLDTYENADNYVRTNARLFEKQQAFDWAIIQSDALAELRKIGAHLPSKIITFSANDSSADIHLDRGLIISRLGNWSGPLLDIDQCQLRGPHNAENLMAALAVGHALREPLDRMVETFKVQRHAAHRFELVAEINGVQFINDSKATNVDALRSALLAARPGTAGQPNVWLIAGGKDKGLDFHTVSPLISKRVKGVFLIGEAREKIRSAWSLFTPCTLADSLLEAVSDAAKNASTGDVVLLSPACSSLDQFQSYQQRGEKFYAAVKSISGGGHVCDPNISGGTTTA